jgi:hypothetical protein
VTDWFDRENQRQSPDEDNGRQLRRITRKIKKFAKSRPSWSGQIAGGFMITKLVVESYKANREDKALYNTMRAIRDRLEFSLVVKHPVTPNETITKGANDPKARVFKERLADAISWLEILFDEKCTRKDALAAWDKVFNTDFFGNRLEKQSAKSESAVSQGLLNAGLIRDFGRDNAPPAVQKSGSGTYA